MIWISDVEISSDYTYVLCISLSECSYSPADVADRRRVIVATDEIESHTTGIFSHAVVTNDTEYPGARKTIN